MKNITKLIALSFIIATTSYAEGKYENNYFSIKSLVDDKNISNTQPLLMCLSASDGFAPNINIQTQKYSNSLTEYAKLSTAQFKQLKFNVIQNKKGQDCLIFEYTGKLQGKELHWYAMVYKKDDNIFLITATATKKQWTKQSKKLIDCVRSFKLK